MKLEALLAPDALQAVIAAGHVRRQVHPTEPLAILNYTQTAMWERAWGPVTRNCRGLIYRTDTNEIVARPFPKFFNHGEPEAGDLDLAEPAVVTDKLDGSMGTLYPLSSGEYAIATRGSFTSEQALHATEIWQRKYQPVLDARQPYVELRGRTWLFEILYPENRIVLDYADFDDLVLLAILDDAGHEISEREYEDLYSYEDWHKLPIRVQRFECNTLEDALRLPPRKNAEGVVVFFPRTQQRVKIKQDDYVALHRVLTNTTPRKIWEFLAVDACKRYVDQPKHWASKIGLDPDRAVEILSAGDNWLEVLLKGVPDEFFKWVQDTMTGIKDNVSRMRLEAQRAYDLVQCALPAGATRKDFAQYAAAAPHRKAVFALYDDEEIDTYLWKQAYPDAQKGMTAWLKRSEDVA